MALSQSLREAILAMELIKELKSEGFPTLSTSPKIYCKAFEDNSGALEMAKFPKLRPRTKHINIFYHHFRDYVRKKEIEICKIGTENQLADMLTKPLPQNLFVKHIRELMGW